MSNLNTKEIEFAKANELLNGLISSLILDSDSKIGVTFAGVLKNLSGSLGCLTLISPEKLEPGTRLFVGSSGSSEFFTKFSDQFSSLDAVVNFESIEPFFEFYKVELSLKRLQVVKTATGRSSIHFIPLIENDGRHIGLLALEVSDGQEPLITDIFRAAITSVVNRINTYNFLGVKFAPVSEVVAGLAHDLRGGLALIGMQNELSRFQGSSPSELGLARERISSGLAAVESASDRIQGFIELLFPPFYAAKYCSPLNAIYAAIASLPWRQEVKSLIKLEIDSSVSNARIDVSGAVTYWIFRSVISFMSDPRRMNKSLNQIDVHLGIETDTATRVFLRCRTPMSTARFDANGPPVETTNEPVEGLVIMSRAKAFELWVKRIGFETKLTTKNGVFDYEVSIR
ncbi:MAG: hypothetical protein ACO3ED_07825 [Ilumatobacteraceae bacterium]